MDEKQAGQFFISELSRLIRKDLDPAEKIIYLGNLIIQMCQTAIQDTGIQFHTAFSIIAYTGHRYHLPGRLLYNIHRFRRSAAVLKRQNNSNTEYLQTTYHLGLKVCSDMIRIIFGVNPSPEILAEIPSDKVYLFTEDKVLQFKKYQRVLILDNVREKECLIAVDQARPGQKIEVYYNLEGRNEIFNDCIQTLGDIFSFPVEANLVDLEIDEKGRYLPKALVIEPDFLIDITAVAECFNDYGIADVSYYTRKFLPMEATKYLLLGHIANFFLDELMGDLNLKFQALISRVFRLNPLAFSLFDDATTREIVEKAQKHFVSLKQVIYQAFPREGIQIRHCFLEPTFYSERYGLQGRLDVLHHNPETRDSASIIELKSGKPYRANAYGLSHSHYIQTLMYDLLIKSMSDDRLKPTNYILYSVKDADQLRFAPAVRSQQYEALATRNNLLAIEMRLSQADSFLDHPDEFLVCLNRGQHVRGFTKRDLQSFESRYAALSTLEKKYFLSMTAMIAREHRLAKVGSESQLVNRGQAALWLSSPSVKEEQFNIISHVELTENRTEDTDPVLHFSRTAETNPLANFRKGDLAIVYPWSDGNQPLSTQLFKGTIITLNEKTVSIRLRAKQFNSRAFDDHTFWNIEHDVLDSSFNAMYQSLYGFASASISNRQRFLTLRPPSPPSTKNWEEVEELTTEQNRILQKIISAKDYFLLWGPPGTGKTSMVLRHLVEYLARNTDEQVLIVAYTNRAVDEICHAIVDRSEIDRAGVLRVGSRYSTDPAYSHLLLSTLVDRTSSRQELRELLDDFRIVVGTLSSVLGKQELFALKSFNRLIIDEATQVLEPMMAGILPQFEKVLLIGDHKQLPAVVTQRKSLRSTADSALHAIGLKDLGNSYFERVYRRCVEEDWNWAFDSLRQQGRMHRDIMRFPSEHFYDGMLETLPSGMERAEEQSRSLSLQSDGSDLSDLLAKERMVFIPVQSGELASSKTSEAEAKLIPGIVRVLRDLYLDSGRKSFGPSDLGIITPYRAQIALIRDCLSTEGIECETFTIDTVERYQGGARNIIIISLCVNSIEQLDHLISESDDGVDRKLNVALTRAREQLIVLGDPEILKHNPTYDAFIQLYSHTVAEMKVT